MKRPFLWTFLLSSCALFIVKLKMWGVLLGMGIFLMLSLAVLLFLLQKGKKDAQRHIKIGFICVITGVLTACAAIRMNIHEQQLEAISELAKQGTEVKGTGRIKQVKETDYGYILELTACKIILGEKAEHCNHLSLYFSSPKSGQKNQTKQYHRGERVLLQGVPVIYEQARNEGGYDEAAYAYGAQKLCEFKEPKVQVIEEASVLGRMFTHVSERAKQIFESHLSKADAGIARAMLTGDKMGIDAVDESLFYEVGVGHILAISGLHLNILGLGLYSVLDKLTFSLKSRCIIAGLATLLFTVFTGGAVSSVRSFVMMSVMFFSYVVGRKYDFFSSLGLAGTLILFLQPWALFSTSFLYSFLAVAGVGMTQAFIKATFVKIHPLLQALLISLGAWLFTLPVSLMMNYHISWVGIFLNIIVIPLMSPLLVLVLFGLLGGLAGSAMPLLGGSAKVSFFLAEKLLWLLRQICRLADNIPLQDVITGKPDRTKAILFIAVLVYIFMRAMRQKKRRLLLIIPILTVWMLRNPYDYKGPEFVMLDVGQGDGMYISDGEGKHFFVDGGSSSVSNIGKQRILPFLYYRRITVIDGWFVSHCDKDHISGLTEVLESGFCVKKLFLYENAVSCPEMQELLELAKKNKTEVIWLNTGDTIRSGDVCFSCLNIEVEEDINNRSLILKLRFDITGTEVLLAGDVDAKTEEKLAKIYELEEIFIWKATHHGSKYSNSEKILSEMKPLAGLISCGKNNLYGHPGKEAVERMEAVGMRLFYTTEDGQITIRFYEKKVMIYSYIMGGISCTFS